jgi:hypothetical protein
MNNKQISIYDFSDLDKPKNNMTKKQSRKGKQNKRRGRLVW